jgi:predicted DCC family thiol-disulfide oxidoreductase YuxK
VRHVETAPIIILFDGICNLCSQIVQFVIRHDPEARFKFASLQSEAGQRVMRQQQLPEGEMDSFILIADGRAYKKSAAALQLARRLGGPWPLLYIFIAVPGPIRDAVYDWVARNRYRWFGNKESCLIPTAELKQRFLE